MKIRYLKHVLGVALVATSTSYGGIVNPGPETPLYTLLGLGNNANAQTAPGLQTVKDTWSTTDLPQFTSLLIEIAGNANFNEFGIYDTALGGGTLPIYPGTEGPNTGLFRQLTVSMGTVSVTGGGSLPLLGTGFGFYLKTPTATFYSDPSKNGAGDAVNNDQLATYDINSTLYGQPPFNNGNTGWILAWEDIARGSSDGDYNDLVVSLTSAPIPEPTTIIAGGLLLLPFAASMLRTLRRKRTA